MCLIDDQQIQLHPFIDFLCHPVHVLIICHSGSAFFFPVGESLLFARAMHKIWRHIAEFHDLPAPVDQHRGRAYYEEAAPGIFSVQMGHRRDGLYGLAQTHLIPQQHFFLLQDIARSEPLIGSKIPFEAGQVQRMCLNLRRQLCRNTAVDHLLPGLRAGQLLEKSIESGTVFFKVLQGGGSRHRQSLPIHLYESLRPVIQTAAEEDDQSGCRENRSLPFRAP